MAVDFSYSGDPRKSDKDKVRFLIGDTDANDPQLGDSEILYALESEGNAFRAGVACAVALAAKFSRLTDESVGDVSKSYSKRAEAYRELAKDLRRRNAERGVVPYAGGISVAEKEAVEQNTDRVDPAFTRDLHDNERYATAEDDENCY